jgi:undecaprenyl-diphosphatase
MPPSFWESLLLGAIQGVSELLPISGSGHRALLQLLFGVSSGAPAVELLLGLGTLLATWVVVRSSALSAVSAGFAAVRRPSLLSTAPGARDALVIVLAALPSALVSFWLRHVVERWGQSPLAIGLGLLVTGGLLLATRFARPGRDEQPGVIGALLMGVAQGAAALPGLSPLAATLTLALLFGVRRERAFELALLVSLPVALGNAVVNALTLSREAAMQGSFGPAALAGVTAFLMGSAALWLLRHSVMAGVVSWFVAWLVPVSLATLALATAWPHR